MRKKILILFLVFISSQLFSQEKFGSISGVVSDSAKIPLDGVILKLVGTYLGAVTDYEGKYSIENVSPGIYTLRVEVEGFRTVEYTDINVKEDER